MIISDVVQGSPEWKAERAGKISASRFDLILTSKGARTSGVTRTKYLHQLAGERMSGEPEDSYSNEWMTRGTELEPIARMYFEEQNGLLVQQVGIVYSDSRKVISCSPDGIVLDTTGYESKCPKLSTHIGYLDTGKLPSDYKQQVQGSMMVTGFSQWYFYSYHPQMKPLQLLVDRDEQYCELLREATEEFNAEVEALVERLR